MYQVNQNAPNIYVKKKYMGQKFITARNINVDELSIDKLIGCTFSLLINIYIIINVIRALVDSRSIYLKRSSCRNIEM